LRGPPGHTVAAAESTISAGLRRPNAIAESLLDIYGREVGSPADSMSHSYHHLRQGVYHHHCRAQAQPYPPNRTRATVREQAQRCRVVSIGIKDVKRAFSGGPVSPKTPTNGGKIAESATFSCGFARQVHDYVALSAILR
jgi:hypothetical protein